MTTKYGTHEKCGAWRRRDGRTLICGRSAGHSVLKCYDPDRTDDADGGYFLAPERKGYPKIQPLGIRKLTPMASELADALDCLRRFLDPKDDSCSVRTEVREDFGLQRYLESWVEGPLTRALATVDPSWRAREIDQGRPDPL